VEGLFQPYLLRKARGEKYWLYHENLRAGLKAGVIAERFKATCPSMAKLVILAKLGVIRFPKKQYTSPFHINPAHK